MIDEIYTAFRGWDFDRTTDENYKHITESNSIGASSVSWLGQVYKVMHRRFEPDGRDRPLVELAQAGCSYDVWVPLLLWHTAQAELLLYDFLVEWLFPRHAEGVLRVRTDDLHPYLAALYERGLVKEPWKQNSIERVASGLLRMACDFGLLEGTRHREFASYHLPEESFLYLLHAMTDRQPNASEVVRSRDWRMYLMDTDDVEQELFRLHQYRKLHYEVAGTIAQLSLPCESAAAYAKELAA